MYCESSINLHHSWETWTWKFIFLLLLLSLPLLLFSLPFSFLTHNFRTMQRIQAICTPNKCSTNRDCPFVGANCMGATVGKMWLQRHVAVFFLYAILCLLTRITQKLKFVWGCSTYQTTAPLLEISPLWLGVVCEIWMVSYGSKHATQPFSDTTFCVYLHS